MTGGIDCWSQRTKQNLRSMVSGTPERTTSVCLLGSIHFRSACKIFKVSLLSITQKKKKKARVKTRRIPIVICNKSICRVTSLSRTFLSDIIASTISEPQVIICDKPNCVLISGSLCGCVHEAELLYKGN